MSKQAPRADATNTDATNANAQTPAAGAGATRFGPWLDGWRGLALLVVLQISAFVLIARHTDAIVPDAIAYMRLGQYYRHGQWDLAVSGYWGPMISWLTAAALCYTDNLEVAGQSALGASNVLFLVGSYLLYRRLPVSGVPTNLLAAMSGLFALQNSMFGLNSDLLVSGLLFVAASQLLADDWSRCYRRTLFSGAAIGLAYLAKAVALPLGLLIALAWTVLRVVLGEITWRQASARFAATALAALLVASPWIGLLSVKFGRLTIGSSGAIAHSLVGPDAQQRPYRHAMAGVLIPPEPGRLTTWEDPSQMLYPYWSPWASWDNARHQAWVIAGNLTRLPGVLAKIDFLLLGPIGCLLAFFLAWPWREQLRSERWRWAALPLLCNGAIYLPVFAPTQRYYFPLFPYLAVGACGCVGWLTEPRSSKTRHVALIVASLAILAAVWVEWQATRGTSDEKSDDGRHFWFVLAPHLVLLALLIGLAIFRRAILDHRLFFGLGLAAVFASLSASNLAHVGKVILQPQPSKSLDARRLAEQIAAAHVEGALGAAPAAIHDTMSTAFFLDRPFWGNAAAGPGAADQLYQSGVPLVIALRDEPAAAQLRLDTRFESLDAQVFPAASSTSSSPSKFTLFRPRKDQHP